MDRSPFTVHLTLALSCLLSSIRPKPSGSFVLFDLSRLMFDVCTLLALLAPINRVGSVDTLVFGRLGKGGLMFQVSCL
jgi:hypothetical protein